MYYNVFCAPISRYYFFRGFIGKTKARTNAKQHRKLTASVEEFEKESLEGSTHNSEQKIKMCLVLYVYNW